MVQQAIEHCADCGHIAKKLAPVFHGSIRGQQRAEPFVAAHDDFQQILGSSVGQFAHAEIIENKQGNSAYRLHVVFACAFGRGIGQFVKQNAHFPDQRQS